MDIALVAYGTRGDVQPFLALAWTLRARGHAVRLIAPANFASWIARAEVPMTAIPLDVPALMAEDAAKRMLAAGDIASFFRWMGKVEASYDEDIGQALLDGTAGAEVIVTHALMQDRVAAIAAARRVPVVPVYFYPVLATRELPSPFVSTRDLGLGALNRASHALLDMLFWNTARGPAERLRRTLGVAPASGSFTRQVQARGLPSLLAYDEALVARPSDWPAAAYQTGAWDMPKALREQLGEARADAELEAWLAEGEPPVFLGFGSMPVLDGEAMTALVREAVAAAGRRAVLAAGWSKVAGGSDARVRVVGEVDHDRLLPRCAAAVHHGGAGTTRASLRAGVPTWVCSVFADQPFWGARCRALGVGGTFPFPKLTAARLAEAIRSLHAPEVAQRARTLGEGLRGGDGLTRAADWVEARAGDLLVPV